MRNVEEIMRGYMKDIFTEDEVDAMGNDEVMEFMEGEAREWLCAEDDWDATTVANAIMGIHEGYRCEQEEVPEEILAWASLVEDGNR